MNWWPKARTLSRSRPPQRPPPRRSKMKANRKLSTLLIAALVVTIVVGSTPALRAQSAPDKKNSKPTQWSVQVDKVDPGDVELASAFQIAIYENLLHEMNKTTPAGVDLAPPFQIAIYKTLLQEINKPSRFKQVFRSGDRDASAAAN